MTQRAEWQTTAGAPSAGPDLGNIKPGETKSTTQVLRNTGDESWAGVAFTLTETVEGLTVTVAGAPLAPGVTLTTPEVDPGEGVQVVYTLTLPATAAPGDGRIGLYVRPLA